MTGEGGFEGQAFYQIAVQGRLDERWADWFDGMTAKVGRSSDGSLVTTLTGPVSDQAALRGILNKMWDLHLTVISVTRTDVGGT